ncbi:MAG TPA: hypothetical protein VNI77_12195 [Nitrososphaera sp.]|nr:hypothetical protein [Nitrososphaera sp.]
MDTPITHSGNREQKTATTNEKKRAIAGGITTIALIAVAVVIAAVAGSYAFNTSSTAQGGIRAVIENAELIRDGTGAGTFVATVKNNGGVHIETASISIPGVTGATVTINDIASGQTKSGSASISAANMVNNVAGTVLVGTATYTGPDGGTATETFSVTVRTR